MTKKNGKALPSFGDVSSTRGNRRWTGRGAAASPGEITGINPGNLRSLSAPERTASSSCKCCLRHPGESVLPRVSRRCWAWCQGLGTGGQRGSLPVIRTWHDRRQTLARSSGCNTPRGCLEFRRWSHSESENKNKEKIIKKLIDNIKHTFRVITKAISQVQVH